LSHRGIVAIIFIVGFIGVGIYSALSLIEEQEQIQASINSIQQDIVIETISTSDDVKLKVYDNNYERGRIPELSNVTVTINDLSLVSDDTQLNTTGRSLFVVLNDGVGVEGTVPQE